jgi:hypothetical protein
MMSMKKGWFRAITVRTDKLNKTEQTLFKEPLWYANFNNSATACAVFSTIKTRTSQSFEIGRSTNKVDVDEDFTDTVKIFL